jgi:ABC-2 type transport system permease protein
MRTLIRFSFNSAFGVGRGEKAKMMPVLVVAAVYLPALIQIGVASATGSGSIIHYAAHLQFTAFLLALFAAAQAPELIVSDKQHGVLSLYLSRPIRAADYAIAKVAALTLAMLVITLGPQLLLFVGKVFIATSPWPAFKSEFTKLFPIVGGTLLTSVFIASIGLLLASFAMRRGYATASVIVFFLLLPAVVEMFRSVTSGDIKRYAILLHPVYLITGFADWLFTVEALRRTEVGRAELPGELYMYVMVGVTALCITLLVRRYQRIEA